MKHGTLFLLTHRVAQLIASVLLFFEPQTRESIHIVHLEKTTFQPDPLAMTTLKKPAATAAGTDFPKMPLGSELEKKHDVFALGIEAVQQPLPVDGSKAGFRQLQETEPIENMFSKADTRVFVRCRPILSGEEDRVPCVTHVPGYKESILLTPKMNVAGQCSVQPYPLSVDATFGATDTNDMVHMYCSELVELALAGGSSSLMCYGQTGSGKTYTSLGLLRNFAHQFEKVIVDGKHEVTVTFVELHHEGCRDLISGETNINICEVGSAINLQHATESKLTSAQHLLDLTETAVAARSTKATARNEGSSRSHMVVRFYVKDIVTPWASPGILCLADLAGSESTGDSMAHDKARVIETKFINSSLMTLKDCIRARGIAATSTKHVHIPYRRTPLTMIMKDSFELVVRRPTKTAVIACVSPLLTDVRHTANTLRYASLLYVSPKSRVVLEKDEKDPNNWDRPKALSEIAIMSRDRVKPEVILPEGDGRALVMIPEAEFIKRAMTCGLGEKAAKDVYVRVWKLICDSRTKTRTEMMKVRRDPLQTLPYQQDMDRLFA